MRAFKYKTNLKKNNVNKKHFIIIIIKIIIGLIILVICMDCLINIRNRENNLNKYNNDFIEFTLDSKIIDEIKIQDQMSEINASSLIMTTQGEELCIQNITALLGTEEELLDSILEMYQNNIVTDIQKDYQKDINVYSLKFKIEQKDEIYCVRIKMQTLIEKGAFIIIYIFDDTLDNLKLKESYDSVTLVQ